MPSNPGWLQADTALKLLLHESLGVGLSPRLGLSCESDRGLGKAPRRDNDLAKRPSTIHSSGSRGSGHADPRDRTGRLHKSVRGGNRPRVESTRGIAGQSGEAPRRHVVSPRQGLSGVRVTGGLGGTPARQRSSQAPLDDTLLRFQGEWSRRPTGPYWPPPQERARWQQTES